MAFANQADREREVIEDAVKSYTDTDGLIPKALAAVDSAIEQIVADQTKHKQLAERLVNLKRRCRELRADAERLVRAKGDES